MKILNTLVRHNGNTTVFLSSNVFHSLNGYKEFLASPGFVVSLPPAEYFEGYIVVSGTRTREKACDTRCHFCGTPFNIEDELVVRTCIPCRIGNHFPDEMRDPQSVKQQRNRQKRYGYGKIKWQSTDREFVAMLRLGQGNY